MRILTFAILLTIIFSSCTIFKSTPERKKRPSPKPEDKNEETTKKAEEKKKPEAKIDTLELQEDTSIISEITEPGYTLRNQYRIKVLLPLDTLQEMQNPEVENAHDRKKLNHWNRSFMDYLAGFKFGMEQVLDSLPNFSYRLSVESIGDFDVEIKEKDSLEFQDTDVLIGGVTEASLRKMSNWSAKGDRIYISPWVPFQPLAPNIRYIQLMPNLQSHCDVLSNHLMKHYQLKNIYIITSEKNKERAACFNQYFNQQEVESTFQTIVLDEEVEIEQILNKFSEQDTNILVVPEDRQKGFIHGLISKVSIMNDYNFKIYGLEAWLNYDLLHDYFEKMPFYISVDQYIQRDSSYYKQFEQAYFDEYSTLPTEWTIKGYDHAWFISKGLSQYGLDLPKNIGQFQYMGLGTEFIFEPVESEQSGQDKIYHNVNNGVQIIEYKNHQFQKIRE